MRRTASEVLRSLEGRIAKLERQAKGIKVVVECTLKWGRFPKNRGEGSSIEEAIRNALESFDPKSTDNFSLKGRIGEIHLLGDQGIVEINKSVNKNLMNNMEVAFNYEVVKVTGQF